MVQALQELRDLAARPVRITSWYRCPDHNQSKGGQHRSQHLLGNAADIVIDGLKPIEIYCLGNLEIRSYSEEFQGWTLQLERRFEPTIQDWVAIQRIADYLLSSPRILWPLWLCPWPCLTKWRSPRSGNGDYSSDDRRRDPSADVGRATRV